MKKFLLWLAKIFKVDLVTEKIIYRDKIVEVPVEVIKEVEKQVALEGVIEGDVTVKGNLTVEGSLMVTGEIACYKIKETKMAALPTTGITTSMVASAIGAATNDVGRLCTHPNINKWAKYKPVAIERVSGSNSGEFAIPRYGLKVPTFPSLQLALEHYITYDGAVWEYIRPLSKPQYPARLGDFRKYEHNAERFYDFEFDDYVEEFYPITFFSINLKLKQEDELSVSALDMRLNNKYFGVLVAKDNVPTISAYAITDNEIDIDSETEFTTSLIIPMAQMTAGSMLCVHLWQIVI